jgi:two-component system OmpR family response regulator
VFATSPVIRLTWNDLSPAQWQTVLRVRHRTIIVPTKIKEFSLIVQHEIHLPARILVVDEDSSMRATITDYLADHGLRAHAVSGCQATDCRFGITESHLVLLSVGQCHDRGLELLSEIRSRSNVPIIVASGHESGGPHSIAALERGADDHLMHPIALRELVARVRAVLRRDNVEQRVRCNQTSQVYHFGGWQLDARNRALTNPDGKPVRLTKCEYAVLLALLEAPEQPLTRTQILDATRIHDDVYDRCVDVHISRLRRKLEVDPTTPLIIQTARGTGYIFALSVERL